MELQACASRKGHAGGARLLRSNAFCPFLCPRILPSPSPPRLLLRFGASSCVGAVAKGGGGGARAEGGGGGGSEATAGAAVGLGAATVAAGCVAAGGGPASTMVSTVKGPPGSGVAEFFLLSALSERVSGFPALSIAINPIFRSFFSIGRAVQSISRKYMPFTRNRIGTHFFLTFAAGLSLTTLFYRGFALKIKDFRRALLLCLREYWSIGAVESGV